MTAEPPPFRNDIPSLARRGVAKAIDFIAVAFTVVGFSSVTHSYLAGLLIGYAWLALSDSSGSLGKWVMKLEVRDHGTGDECSVWASIVRNLPIIAVVLPPKLHQALRGMDRQQYREAHSAVVLLMACVGLLVLVAMLTAASRNAECRHIGDYLARTVVVFRKRKSSSSGDPSLNRPATSGGQGELPNEGSGAVEAVLGGGSGPADYDRLPASRQFHPGARRAVDKRDWRRCANCDQATPVWPDVVVEGGQLRRLGTYSYVCGHCGHCQAGAPTTDGSLRYQAKCFDCGTSLEEKEQCPKCGFPRGWKRVQCPNCKCEHPVFMPHWVDQCDTFILECVKCEQAYVSLCIC